MPPWNSNPRKWLSLITLKEAFEYAISRRLRKSASSEKLKKCPGCSVKIHNKKLGCKGCIAKHGEQYLENIQANDAHAAHSVRRFTEQLDSLVDHLQVGDTLLTVIIVQSQCAVCGAGVASDRHKSLVETLCEVPVIENGATVYRNACCEACKLKAFRKWEKDKQCLIQQERELKNVKRVMKSMTIGLTKMTREASQSQAKASKQQRTLPSS